MNLLSCDGVDAPVFDSVLEIRKDGGTQSRFHSMITATTIYCAGKEGRWGRLPYKRQPMGI